MGKAVPFFAIGLSGETLTRNAFMADGAISAGNTASAAIHLEAIISAYDRIGEKIAELRAATEAQADG